MNGRQQTEGFIVPLVLMVSLATLFILTPLVSRFVASLDISHTDYYTRLAKEAAQAGVVYATACYNQSNNEQTWGPAASKPDLDPSTDCTGTAIAGKSKYLFDDGNTRSYFDVGDISYSDTMGIEILAQGHVEKVDSEGDVVRSSSSELKRVTWGDESTEKNFDYDVDMGNDWACALIQGAVYCWSESSPTPQKVTGLLTGETIVGISIGDYEACAISDDGKLFCWSYYWQGGRPQDIPIQVTGALAGKNVTEVGVGYYNTCAIADGQIYCWGTDSYGNLGNGAGLSYGNYSSGVSTTTPTLVTSTYLPSGYQAVKLAKTGGITTQMCAILTAGQLYCWGGNRNSELGLNIGVYATSWWSTHYPSVSAPYPVYNGGYLDGYGVSVVATNGSTNNANNVSCAISNGYPYCTMSNPPASKPANGKFYRTTGSYTTPMTDIAVGGQTEQTCGLAQDGLYCWLATGAPPRNTPTLISTLGGYPTTDLKSVSAYWNNVCGLFKDGHVFCWDGFNGSSGGTLANVHEVKQVYGLVHGYYF